MKADVSQSCDDLDGAAPVNAAGPAERPSGEREIDADPGEAGSPRRGWWQRIFGA